MSATRRAEIGSRGFAFRSWRAYGKFGITAVMRLADASFAAWIMKRSSMTLRSTGSQAVWTRKTSAPRIDSSYRQWVSPFGKVLSSISPSPTPSWSAMRCARSWCERPEKTMRRFCGPRSIQWPTTGCVTEFGPSRPGRTSSVVAVPGCIPLLVLLRRARYSERVGRDVLGNHRSGSDPCSVSDLERRDERIVDAGPDVTADRRTRLREPGLVREVRGDRAGADVRVLADLGVADV